MFKSLKRAKSHKHIIIKTNDTKKDEPTNSEHLGNQSPNSSDTKDILTKYVERQFLINKNFINYYKGYTNADNDLLMLIKLFENNLHDTYLLICHINHNDSLLISNHPDKLYDILNTHAILNISNIEDNNIYENITFGFRSIIKFIANSDIATTLHTHYKENVRTYETLKTLVFCGDIFTVYTKLIYPIFYPEIGILFQVCMNFLNRYEILISLTYNFTMVCIEEEHFVKIVRITNLIINYGRDHIYVTSIKNVPHIQKLLGENYLLISNNFIFLEIGNNQLK